MIKTGDLTKPSVFCFGEILWDNLPSGRMAGGAPMNVAYHLNKAGAHSNLISRTGNDQSGAELISFCSNIGLPVNLIQTDQIHATGEVIGKVTANHEVVYDILLNVAWDYIAYKPELKQLVQTADAFVFGSLAARNSTSRDTLLQLLETASFRIFDVNLRAPHYSTDVLKILLEKTDLLKLNENELPLIAGWLYKTDAPEADSISFLQQTFSIPEIIVTKGAEGASYYTKTASFKGDAYPITVADTVGAGDSFLAAFLYKKLIGSSEDETLDYALATGAFIAEKNGACPPYTKDDLNNFIKIYKK